MVARRRCEHRPVARPRVAAAHSDEARVVSTRMERLRCVYAFSRHRLQRAAEIGEHTSLTVLDASLHFVFLIDRVPVRFYRGAADDPTDRTMRRQQIEAQQLSLALRDSDAVDDGLVFRLAVETGEAGRVDRVVFVALRGEADAVECFWPVPLEVEPAGLPRSAPRGPVQLRLIADDGYEGPEPGGRRGREGGVPPLPRRRMA